MDARGGQDDGSRASSSRLGDGRGRLTNTPARRGRGQGVPAEPNQAQSLEALPLDAEHHRLARSPGETLLRQKAAELAVQPLQYGVLEGQRGGARRRWAPPSP